jgi:hypothetical protein
VEAFIKIISKQSRLEVELRKARKEKFPFSFEKIAFAIVQVFFCFSGLKLSSWSENLSRYKLKPNG